MEIESTFEEAKLSSAPRTMDHDENESHHQERNFSAPKTAEIESRTAGSNNFGAAELTVNETKRFCLLAANVLLILVSTSGTPLLVRIYFLHGGSRKWFSAFLQTAGFPILILPPLISFLRRRGLRRGAPGARKLFSLRHRLLLFSIVIGIIIGIDDFLYSYGSSYVPVSTSAILLSTQLGFTALFAFLIVRHKFTASSINAVVILTSASVVLGVDTNGHDRPEGESTAKFFSGFMMLLAAAALYALALPLVELSYAMAKQKVTFMVLMEVQLTIGVAATAVCAVGMAVHNDFQVSYCLLKEFLRKLYLILYIYIIS
ncbi:Purine permease 1 [Apostasia shenzhenica]|uniref:Probable purine permease n=1 Tax=Apostasia shenzhenica TaxID=1088818 RepID=A0A2H9ZSK8_9ASPA|nr:Purine permease 1 [Apostasia shenzhenica]